MKSYVFKVELEPDEDGWHVFYGPWRKIGASTWGKTREEAMKNIQEVLEMIIEELQEEGKPIVETEFMTVSEDNLVSISL